MDWKALLGPAVVAAGVSGIIAVVSMLVNRSTTITLHSQKIDADQKLAERKFEQDQKLAKQKFECDADLADRRFKYDRDLHDHKRRVELAEEVLTAFYRASDVLANARAPISFEDEGLDRTQRAGESEAVTRRRNTFYVPIERLKKDAEVFSKLFALRDRFKAYFGETADQPFLAIHQVLIDVRTSAEALIEDVSDNPTTTFYQAEFFKEMQAAIWRRADGTDKLSQQTKAAVNLVEDICRPILQA